MRNDGDAASGPLTAAFFASLPDWGDWYIGSGFVPDIPAGGSANVTIDWETTGFRGDVPIKVVVAPMTRRWRARRATTRPQTTLTIRSLPDLTSPHSALSDPEPKAGEAVSIAATVANQGQNDAGSQATAIYAGNPDDGGAAIGEAGRGRRGRAEQCHGHTSAGRRPLPGLYRLFARARIGTTASPSMTKATTTPGAIVYVGLATPVELDSGAAGDVRLLAAQRLWLRGRGPDRCGGRLRRRNRTRPTAATPDGRVIYRFDHLLPGHFYHLNITMKECRGRRPPAARLRGWQSGGRSD